MDPKLEDQHWVLQESTVTRPRAKWQRLQEVSGHHGDCDGQGGADPQLAIINLGPRS